MSFQSIALGVRIGAKHAVNFCKRHLPQILVVAGVGGFTATAVVSGKAAIKAKDILKEKDEKLNQIEELKSDPEYSHEAYTNDKKIVKTQTAWKLAKTFAPPVTLGAASAALIFGGHRILGRRAAAALMSAYEAQKKLYDYNANVVQQLGEETAKKLRDGLAIDKLKTAADIQEKAKEEVEKPKEEEKKDPAKHVEFFFGRSTCGFGGGWHDDPFKVWSKIRNAYSFSKDRLKITGHLTVNEILWSEFAYPSIMGGNAGWVDDPKGYGKDEQMEWRIHTNHNTWRVEDFITDEGFKQFRFDPFNEVWIDFIPAHDSERMDAMCSCINDRKNPRV